MTAAQWSRCVDPLLRPSRGGPGIHFLGIDLGLKRDRTALAVVHREGGETVLDELLTFAGTRQSPVSISAVERAIEELHTRFPRLQALADPWQMHATMERLRARGLTIDEHVFSAGSVGRLSATLYEAIASGRLRVFADEELEREVLALRVVYSPTGWRMDHRAGAFSDRAVALALAVQAAGQERYATQLPSYGSVGPSLLEDLGGGFDDGSGRLDPSITYDFKF